MGDVRGALGLRASREFLLACRKRELRPDMLAWMKWFVCGNRGDDTTPLIKILIALFVLVNLYRLFSGDFAGGVEDWGNIRP
jgi:hypothetical protein